MPKYLVETVSMFRMRYVVEGKEESHASDEFVMEVGKESFKEFSQHHMDEVIVSTRELTDDEYLKLFDKDNDYLKNWTEEEKFGFVNKIIYKEDE